MVYFKYANGVAYGFDSNQCKVESIDNVEMLKVVLNRQFPQSQLGVQYSHLLIPGLPCLETICDEKTTLNDNDDGDSIPQYMLKPLIKCGITDPKRIKNIIGYKSGIRSALIYDNKLNTWFRLKGCGNNDKGFIYQCVNDGRLPLIEVRGCSFKHTTFIEMNMTNIINNAFNEYKIPSGNVPILWYKYIKYDSYLTKISPYCSVFQTLGNKRLGDHILNGLNSILHCLMDTTDMNMIQKQCDSILKLYSVTRLENDTKNKYNIMKTYLAVLCELDVINLYNSNIGVNIPLKPKLNLKEIKQLFNFNNFNTNQKEHLESLLEYTIHKYNNLMNKYSKTIQCGSILINIYYHLGFEAGLIQRTLRDNNISWGTYTDPLGTHCNAHANNYILLPKTHYLKHKYLLSAIDFDMAFSKDTYIGDKKVELMKNCNIQFDESKLKNDHSFDEQIIMEINGNRISLAGDPNISTGVHYKNNTNNTNNASINFVNISLRDTLISGFNDGLKLSNKKDIKKILIKLQSKTDKEMDIIYTIFTLCILSTINTIA